MKLGKECGDCLAQIGYYENLLNNLIHHTNIKAVWEFCPYCGEKIK